MAYATVGVPPTAQSFTLTSGSTAYRYLRFVVDSSKNNNPGLHELRLFATGTGIIGGSTVYSATTVELTHTVTAVNDAPVAAAGTLTTIGEDIVDGSNPGTLVSSLVTSFTDADSGAVKGLAVTAVDNTLGIWSYSTDAGSTWSPLTGVSTTAARLLKGNDANYKVRFVPNTNANGTATITYLAWDQTSGTAGSTADVTSNGGSTAYSSSSSTGTITITAVNDAPTVSAPASFALTEDVAGNLTYTGTPLADVDSASLTVTLSVSDGTITGNAGTGITVGGTATARTFAGSV
jgi:hypothetical protein